jgi:hypothetical protein
VQQIRLTTEDDPQRIAALAGQFPDGTWYDTLLTEGDAFATKPNGDPLLCVLRQAVTGQAYEAAYQAIVPLARTEGRGNRGLASGIIPPHVHKEQLTAGHQNRGFGVKTRTRYRPIKKDGTISSTSYAIGVNSFLVGFTDRSARFPYCRQTAYTNQHPARLHALLPCLQRCTTLFAQHLPQRHAAQHAAILQASPDFVIPGTVFTTLTVNRNWSTALHQDAGDLKAGFGVMLCFRLGHYTGGYYVMPQFRIAVDLRAGDLLLSDVHEWHSNTALVGNPQRYERITMVCYFREKMGQCGTMAEELARVKVAKGTLTP